MRTLDRGIKLFQEVAAKTRKEGGTVISGDDAFELHTHLWVLPSTSREQMAAEIGLTVDEKQLRSSDCSEFQDESRQETEEAWSSPPFSGELPKTDDSPKYDGLARQGEDRRLGQGQRGRAKPANSTRAKRPACCWTAPISTPSKAARSATRAHHDAHRPLRGRGHAETRRRRAARRPRR